MAGNGCDNTFVLVHSMAGRQCHIPSFRIADGHGHAYDVDKPLVRTHQGVQPNDS